MSSSGGMYGEGGRSSGGYGGNRGGGDRGGGYQGSGRGGGDRGSGRGSSGRDGDWLCPSPGCGNLNFARRVECNKCGAPSPAGDTASRTSGTYDRGGAPRGGGGGRDASYRSGGRDASASANQGREHLGYPPAALSYGSNYPYSAPSPAYGGDNAVPPPSTYTPAPNSYPPSYGAPPTYAGYAPPPHNSPSAADKVKQCDGNCNDNCDNSRIYISNLPPDVKADELRELFGGIGQVARIKQKRGYKDQWPHNIKIYTDDSGKSKGDAVLSYEDPSAAHSAGGFYNDYDMRGYKISVAMAEKSAPRPPSSFGGGGGRGGYGGGGGDRRRDNYRDGGGSGPDRHHHDGNRSRPY